MANRVILFVVFAIMLTLFVPATHVEDNMLGQFGADFAKVRTQGLALFGLPIKIPRRVRPTTTPVINSNGATARIPQNDTQAADVVLALLERADLVQMVTMVPTPSITPTPIPTSSATATIHITPQPSMTPTMPVATVEIHTTTTITPTVVDATATPEILATATPIVTPTVVLLPNSITDGFRSKMPKKGYWWGSSDGLYIAIGNFSYINSFYSNDAESFQKYVTFSITVRNNRDPDAPAITIDPTKMTLIDLNRRQSTVYRDYIHLDQAFLKTTITPGQSDGGQLIFVIERFAAPAQLIVTYTNADQPDVPHTQTIEFQVWPTIN